MRGLACKGKIEMMSEKMDQEFPYKGLGDRIKNIRQKNKQTIAEVSEAVELDMDLYSKIEQGKECPSEDVLFLLTSYFDVNDNEAKNLYRLAKFDEANPANFFGLSGEDTKTMVIALPADLRVVYTDMAHVVANKNGIVINFMQEAGLGGQPMIASRVGMSKEHAKCIVETLQNALKQPDNVKVVKCLPPPKSQKKTK